MFGKRCDDCGEVRWSVLGRDTQETACPNCGTTMVDERRRPGTRRPDVEHAQERRDAPVRAALSG